MTAAKTIGALTAAALTCVSMASAQGANLTLAHHNAVGSQIANRGDAFKSCAEGSGADLTIQHLPAAQLGTAKEVIEQVKLGAVDMSITDTAYLSELQPELAAFQLPFIFIDWDHAERAMDGDAGALLATTLADRQNLVLLGTMHNGFRDLLTIDKPIRSMDDMAGVQFRSPPLPLWLGMFERLQVQPVTVPWNEVYTAMQTGLVEGLETTPEGMVSSKTYEVGRYVTQSGHMYNLTTLVISGATMDRLDDAQREALKACGALFQSEGNVEVRQLETVSLETMAEAGLEIIQVDKTPFQQALQPAWLDMAGDSPELQAFIAAIQTAQ